MVFLQPIHTGKLNQLQVNQVMVCYFLIRQPNNANSFDWLTFNMKNETCLSVSVRIFAVEYIVNVCIACTYIRTF